MEIIMDEVKNSGADLNMRTLSHHMIYLIGQHGELYREVVARLNPDQLLQVFDMMKIENFGRAMTFLKKLLSLQNALYKAPPLPHGENVYIFGAKCSFFGLHKLAHGLTFGIIYFCEYYRQESLSC